MKLGSKMMNKNENKDQNEYQTDKLDNKWRDVPTFDKIEEQNEVKLDPKDPWKLNVTSMAIYASYCKILPTAFPDHLWTFSK